MGLIEMGPLGLAAAALMATAWTAGVVAFVFGLVAVHSLAGRLIGRVL